MSLRVESPNVKYTDDLIESRYVYQTTDVKLVDSKAQSYVAVPRQTTYTFRTQRRVPRLGVMLVGWGGNNGSTVTAMTLANRMKMEWHTKEGLQKANYFGSITQASTVLLGNNSDDGSSVYVPFGTMLPMVNPNDIVLDGMLSIDLPKI